MLNIEDYIPIIGQDYVNELQSLAELSHGKSVQNINSTFVGGGVAEILSRIIPLFRQLGIDMSWDTIEGDERFFGITKKFHNALQGFDADITEEDLAYFLEINQMNRDTIDLYGDVILIHDPQPIALIEKKEDDNKTNWLWRCHIDLTEPQARPLNFLKHYIKRYDCAIFSTQKYLQGDLGIGQKIIPPSIDPLSNKNKEISAEMIDSTLDRFEIDHIRPIITQISRFDKLKNPVGVIEAYKLVKKEIDCQLVLAGGGATDDPEGPGVLEKVRCAAEVDADIHIIDLPPSSDLEINALQRASAVILQNSLREGFGLTVSEALWKGKPVIASAVGGIPLQIMHEHSGILTKCFEDTVSYLRKLLLQPEYARWLGMNGREHIRNNFLITRHIRDYLLLFPSLQGKSNTKCEIAGWQKANGTIKCEAAVKL